MKASGKLENNILLYLDGTLSGKDLKDFEDQIQSDNDLKKTIENFRFMESAFKIEPLQQPSSNFTSRVMQNLENYPIQNTSSILNSLLLIGGIIVLVTLCTLLLTTGMFDSYKTIIDLNSVSLVDKYVHQSLPAIALNGKVIINIIIFLNLILALIVLDRAVLKPLFQKRIQTHS